MLTEDTWKFVYLTETSVMPCFSLKSNERLLLRVCCTMVYYFAHMGWGNLKNLDNSGSSRVSSFSLD